MADAASFTHYEYIKSPDAPKRTLLLIHGLAGDSSMWDLTVPYFQKHFNVLRYDLPEHGKSGRVPSTEYLTWTFFVNDLKSLVHRLQIGQFHILAHGFGGTLALEYSKLHSDSVVSLTIISTHMTSFIRFKPSLFDYLKTLMLPTGNAHPIGERVARMTSRTPSEEWIKHAGDMMGNLSAETYLHLLKLISTTPTIEYIKTSRIPIFLLFGQMDTLTPPSVLYQFRNSELANTRISVIPNASNCIQIDAPELVANEVTDFIRSVEAPEGDPVTQLVELLHEMSEELHPTNGDPFDIHVTCLRGFRVTVGGVEISQGWNRRLAKEILVYLAIHGNATREELCDVFWENAESTAARTYLRVALSHLRKLLNLQNTHSHFLVTDRATVQLRAKVHCDIVELRTNVENLLSLDASERASQIARVFSELPDPPFLSGFYHQAILAYWYDIEVRLLELGHWCFNHHLQRKDMARARRIQETVVHTFPDYEFSDEL